MDFSLSASQVELRAAAKAFSDREIEPRSHEIDRVGRMADDLLPKRGAAGLLGLTIPPEFGGRGLGHLASILALEQPAYSGTRAWWLVGFNNTIASSIFYHGAGAIWRRFIPPLCLGTAYASIQFTEAATGSDPEGLASMATHNTDYYLLSGSKRLGTFGARNGPAMVFAKDDTGECTAFVMDKNGPGYAVGKI